MYSLINENAGRIIDAFKSNEVIKQSDPSTYNTLIREVHECDVTTSREFQRKYKGFWTMRPGEEYCQEYFTLLQQQKTHQQLSALEIAKKLLPFPTRRVRKKNRIEPEYSIQFSYATKLAHMVNPHLPIYDAWVASFYFLSAKGRNDAAKIRAYETSYDFLVKEYQRIIREELLAPSIKRFKTELDDSRNQTDEKIIDWLIMSFAKLAKDNDWFKTGKCRHT